MKLYHATPFENLGSILVEGIKPSAEGIVYGCTEPAKAAMFVAFRGVKHILVLEFNSNDFIEMHDHDERFWKCKAYGHTGKVKPDMITNYLEYKL